MKKFVKKRFCNIWEWEITGMHIVLILGAVGIFILATLKFTTPSTSKSFNFNLLTCPQQIATCANCKTNEKCRLLAADDQSCPIPTCVPLIPPYCPESTLPCEQGCDDDSLCRIYPQTATECAKALCVKTPLECPVEEPTCVDKCKDEERCEFIPQSLTECAKAVCRPPE
jgi:hypothetical protein